MPGGLLFAVLAAGCRSEQQAAPSAARPPAVAEWIAFHADPDGADDLYAVRTDGSATRPLTQGLEQIAGAAWSSDGLSLAFLARPSGVDDLYIVGADGADLRQLTENQGDHFEVAWSPDGLQLLFVCCDETDPGVYVINADGTGRKRLAENAGQPAWSPDGSRIAYISLAGANPDIYTMKADGTDQRALTSDAAEDVDPAWSPDGEQIAFASRRTGKPQIYVMDADGTNQRALVSDRWNDQQPMWSPDGTQILFTSFRNRDPLLRGIGNADIVVVSRTGAGVRNLTRSPAWEGDPAWSPDGTEIAFSIRSDFGEAGTFRIAVMTAAGGNRRLFRPLRDLADRPANACCPSWQPGESRQTNERSSSGEFPHYLGLYDARVTTPDPTAEGPISTERLDLVLLTGAWLRAYVKGDPLPDLGFTAPDAFLSGLEYVAHLRAEQLDHDRAQEPWLLRAMVLRNSATAVGYAGFHAPPDDRGMVEIGYQVLPAHRGRGYATEAAQGMWNWAARHGARVLRTAIAPDNLPSLAMVHRAGFVEVGQQMDDVDGLELIFEKHVQT